ncbi:STY0301 family protein [Pseudoduganella sp.]|uniref:STY0301 family protein n=1 Tax=Pseudoduganella sp. TaxID=1880898 RepID=UPI0035B3F259
MLLSKAHGALFCCLNLAISCCPAGELTCPASITSSEAITAQVSGWEAVSTPQVHELENAQVYDGHPNDTASLVPDKSSSRGHVHQATWLLAAERERDTWVGCSYKNSSLLLAQKVPPHARRCVLTYQRKGKSRPGELTGVECR